jgi:patatin-related protein
VLEERGEDSAPDAKSELAYRELLKALRGQRDVLTRIVVDTIAGSSAGGINGIFLAKALAHDLNQDALRDLWFTYGDLERIINQPHGAWAWMQERVADVLPLGEGVPRKEAREKLLVAALHVTDTPLLDGDEMAVQIFSALEGMDASAASPPASLLPEHHVLELAVTVTDYYGYARKLPIADPPVVAERQHRHLLQFRYRSDEERSDFTTKENGALTLAARATSSLPLGFPPIHVGTFPDVLAPGATTHADVERFFRAYTLAGATPGWAYLVDGGVLDNKPFAPVLKAIRERPAANEVDRYLMFLEPDPKPPVPDTEAPPEPRPIRAMLGALSGLPRSEPILDELHDLLVRNERVRTVRDTIEANWAPIEAKVLGIVGQLDDAPTDPNELRDANARIHEAARSMTELAYSMYVRVKASAAVDAFGRAACLSCDYTDPSNQAMLVRAVLLRWAERRGLLQAEQPPTPEQLQFVRDVDLGYGQRRLAFVRDGVSWLYRDLGKPGMPTRQQLDRVKERLSEAVAKLEWFSSGRAFAEDVLGGVRTCFGEQRLQDYLDRHGFDPDAFVDDHGDDLDDLSAALRRFLTDALKTFTPELYRDLLGLTADWEAGEVTKKIRRDLLVRYLGFPIWDALLYPVQAFADVGERDAVRIARMSPLDSKLLEPTGPLKVLGVQLGHGYAFFSLEARENDYLWGRLDAAERMVRLLLTRTNEQGELEPGDEQPEYVRSCQAAFRAILEEEAAHLPTIAETVEKLRARVEALGAADDGDAGDGEPDG